MESEKNESVQVEQPHNENGKSNHFIFTSEPHEKKERKEHKSEYVFDADAIKIDTEIPPLPKKSELLKKPDLEEVKEKEKKIRDKIGKLIEQKVSLYLIISERNPKRKLCTST